MSQCERLEAFLDRRLGPAEGTAFEKHLDGCPICRAEVDHGQGVQAALGAWMEAQDRVDHPATRTEAARMTEAISERIKHTPRRLSPLVWVAAAAAAVAVAVGTVFLTWDKPVPSRLVERPPASLTLRVFAPDGEREIELKGPTGKELVAPADGRLLASIGRDRIGLAPRGRLRLEKLGKKDVRIRIESGTVACAVSPGPDRGEFTVEAGRFTVRVKGTRFSVSLDQPGNLTVSVIQGTVEVERPDHPAQKLNASEQLNVSTRGEVSVVPASPAEKRLLDRLLREVEVADTEPIERKAEAEKPTARTALPDGGQWRDRSLVEPQAQTEPESLDTWREWIIDGRLEEAADALQSHLARQTQDVEAWSLLATCQRKAGHWNQAVESWRRVIELAGPKQADRARFMAASLLQDRLGRHAEAAALLEKYVDSTGARTVTRAEAMVRLARALIALGRQTRARHLLQKVADTHGRTPVAVQARSMLTALDEP